MPKARKLDSATEQQAIALAQWLIKLRGGLSRKHSREYWRFSAKAELRGPVEADERFLQGIKDALKELKEHGEASAHYLLGPWKWNEKLKDALAHGEVSVSFLPGPTTWNEKLAAKLIADAKQGNADADQVLREVVAEYLQKRILPPNELADYVAACLQRANSRKKQSHKTDYRNWILALTVDDIARHFNLNHTRNREPKEERDCGCSIVARATKLSETKLGEKTIQNAWHDYEGVADQRTPTNYVAQAMFTVDGARPWLFKVRFPRVGLPEAMSRPSNRKAQRAKRVRN